MYHIISDPGLRCGYKQTAQSSGHSHALLRLLAATRRDTVLRRTSRCPQPRGEEEPPPEHTARPAQQNTTG